MSTDTGAVTLRDDLGDDLGDDLRDRAAGHAVMAEALRLQARAPARSRLARLLGRDPLVAPARQWFSSALGEREVGRRLAALGGPWHVLHSVPLGTLGTLGTLGHAGAGIDHLLVGPGGVVTVSSEHHPGARVRVRGKALVVDGRRRPALRDARNRAQLARLLLSAATGIDVPVQSTVAVVAADTLTLGAQPDGVVVLRAAQLTRWVRRRPRVLDDAAVHAVAAAARDPRTWTSPTSPTSPTSQPAAHPSPVVAPVDGFEHLEAQVHAADLAHRAWLTACAVAASSAAAVALLDVLG